MFWHVIRATLAVSALGAVALGQGSATPQRQARRIIGVYDSQGTVDGAEVLDLLSCKSKSDSTGALVLELESCTRAVTSATGNAALNWVLAQHDTAAIRIRKIGYRDTSLAIPVGPADTAGLVIVIDRLAVGTLLPTVTVRDSAMARAYPVLGSFFERERRGIGIFLTPGYLREMEAKGHYLLGDALAAKGAIPRRTVSLSNKACPMAIFYNGVRVRSLPVSSPPKLSDFDAVEFYKGPATTPAQFTAPDGPCGSIVYWGRSR